MFISETSLIKKTTNTVREPINTKVIKKFIKLSPTKTGKKIDKLHPAHTDRYVTSTLTTCDFFLNTIIIIVVMKIHVNWQNS